MTQPRRRRARGAGHALCVALLVAAAAGAAGAVSKARFAVAAVRPFAAAATPAPGTAVSGAPAAPVEWRALQLPQGKVLRYALVMPRDYDARKSYPVLLALPPGDQGQGMVSAALDRYWRAEAERLGWIVVSPVAPERQMFITGGEEALPVLLDRIARDFEVELDRFHLAGVSNGGLAAFRALARWPERFASIVAAPGYPPTDNDARALAGVIDRPFALFVGGDDETWRTEVESTRERLATLGARQVELVVFEGEGHAPESLTGELLFERLETFRQRARSRDEALREAVAMLDDLHRAAADADAYRYLAHFAPDAVFLGTDPSERWELPEWRAFVEEHFVKGTGWTYEPVERHVSLSLTGQVAWFDERLQHARYGEVRGSGVLQRHGDRWKVCQYNLAFPIPNAIAEEVVGRVQEVTR